MKRFAERVAPGAQTTHPAQAGLARVLNSLVVPPFLRRGDLQCLQVVQLASWGRGISFVSELPHKCVLFFKWLAKIRQMCRKITKFLLRFAISGAYSIKFTGDDFTINAKRGLDRLFTYAQPEISEESPHEEPI